MRERFMKRLAIVFPGIGYTAEKPLLHYSRRIAERFGYETEIVPYSGFPKKVKGDKEKMLRSCEIALTQAKEFLAEVCLAQDPPDRLYASGRDLCTSAWRCCRFYRLGRSMGRRRSQPDSANLRGARYPVLCHKECESLS